MEIERLFHLKVEENPKENIIEKEDESERKN